MRLLVIRTSAMGDVALTLPVLREMSDQFPQVEIVMVTREAFIPFFAAAGSTKLFSPDFAGRHKGVKGLIFLFIDLRKSGKFDYVIDLHDVIRSRILSFLFRISGVPVKRIDKGRSQKHALIKGRKKVQLKHSVERYRDVFSQTGFHLGASQGPWMIPSGEEAHRSAMITGINGGVNIGVAPYAKHFLKLWPEDYMVSLLKIISEKAGVHFWLFGGKEEAGRIALLQQKVPGSAVASGKLTLREEIALMSKLDFMISMDSSNMHMAALTGTRVISIWGATDPLTGFGAWKQPEEYSIRIPVSELTCRPCTVYGKGKCWRHDHACMEWLTPEKVLERITELGIL
jgi:ADP-heptose:LPS heptosyltransferase